MRSMLALTAFALASAIVKITLTNSTSRLSALVITLTLLGPSYAAAQNMALYMDGAVGGIDVPGSQSLDVSASYTFEAWVKYEAGSSVVFRKDGYDTLPYQFAATSSGLQVGVNWEHNIQAGSWCAYDTGGPGDGPWIHVAASFDGSVLVLYRDGVPVQTCPMPPLWSNAALPLHIGWYDSAYGGLAFRQGWLDEVRIWSVARTEQEIASTIDQRIDRIQAGNHSGLVACWNFEGDANDSTGVNDGTVLGSSVFLPALDIPKLDCDGNGSIDSVELGNGTALDCNANGVIDACDIAAGTVPDCNGNGVPDACDIALGTSNDFNTDGIPDECQCADPSTYCTALINSTGKAASIGYTGSTSLTLNDLKLTVTDAIPNQIGIFFMGSFQTQVPFGDGNLCVTGNIQRLMPPVFMDAAGSGTFTADFSDPNSPLSMVQPLSETNFQFWYRDPQPIGNQFNLTDALHVQFCP